MPRSRGSSGGKSSSVRSSYKPARNPPQPVSPAPAPAPAPASNRSAMGGLGGAIVDGIGWGVGTSIARRAVDAIMGPQVIHHETVADPALAPALSTQNFNSSDSDSCAAQTKAFQECINSYGSDITKCQFYMDMLSECRRSSASSLRA